MCEGMVGFFPLSVFNFAVDEFMQLILFTSLPLLYD